MAATGTRSTSSDNSNGSAASIAVEKAKDAGGSVAQAARKARGPALVAGATAAGLAGGLALGSRMPWRRKGRLEQVADAVGHLARELGTATHRAAATGEDVREIREQLDKANRQSPLEVVLDGLTHRRGAHKRES